MTTPNPNQSRPEQPTRHDPPWHRPWRSRPSAKSNNAVDTDGGQAVRMLVASCLATALITTMLFAIWFLDQNVQRLRVSEISNVRSDMALSQDTNADDTAGRAAASDAILANAFVTCGYGEANTVLSYEREQKILVLEQRINADSTISGMKTHGCILEETNAPASFRNRLTDLDVEAGMRSAAWDNLRVAWHFMDAGSGSTKLKIVYACTG